MKWLLLLLVVLAFILATAFYFAAITPNTSKILPITHALPTPIDTSNQKD